MNGQFEGMRYIAGNVRCWESQTSNGEQEMPPEELQESSWRGFFPEPTRWWDNRGTQPSSWHLDFSLASWQKPAWDAGTEVRGQGMCGKLAAHEGHVEVGTWRKLCEDGRIRDIVDALDHLVQRGCHVDNNVFYHVLKKCIEGKDLVLGRRIHALTIQCGYEGDAFLATHLIGMYATDRKLEEALRVFSKVSTPDSYNWATIIFAYARHGEGTQAIHMYRQMLESTVKPTDYVYVAVLKACAADGDLVTGKEIHAQIRASGGTPNVFVQTCLVDMYAKCRSLGDARRVFDRLAQRNVVTWNALFAGYVQQGLGQEALSLYDSMQQDGLTIPDSVTFVCLLQACANIGVGALHQGMCKFRCTSTTSGEVASCRD